MHKLSAQTLCDIGIHTCDKIGRDIDDAIQLIDDPEQRAALTYNVAKALVKIAADFTIAAFQVQKGHSIARREAVYALLKQMLQHEGIRCREVDDCG